MSEIAKKALNAARNIQRELAGYNLPPEEGSPSNSQLIIHFSLVKDSRGYIEKVVHQINGCYENGWYDSCAVMVRRLIETLIIEVYEHHEIASNIKNNQENFLYLGDLVEKILNESDLNLGREAKVALPKLKVIGDRSAHNRRFIAHRRDIDDLKGDIRIVVQELLYLAGFK